MNRMMLTSISLATMLVLSGCSSGSGSGPEQTGGHSGSGSGGQSQAGGSEGGFGGSVGSGGSAGTGGKAGSGGAVGSGGKPGSGGSSASGGSGSGGANGTGGKTGTGGAGSGGAIGTGGTTAGAGGSNAKGGATGVGGVQSTGGAESNGGVTGAGGNTAKGPDGGLGGTTGKGGGPGAGGGSGAGGGAGGGTSVTISASGYPAAGASGQAAPNRSRHEGDRSPVGRIQGCDLAHPRRHQSVANRQLPKLQALNDKGNNARFTFYMETGKSNEMGSSVWPQAVKDGHELGNHTKSHSPPANTADIQAAEDTLKSMFGVTAYSFAAPNGDSTYISAIPTMKEFLTNRTAGNNGSGFHSQMTPAPRSINFHASFPAKNASSSAIADPLNKAVSAGQWQINLVHGFNKSPSGKAETDGAYQAVDIDQYTAAVTSIKATGNAWIDTVGNVSAYWIAGYKFSKLTPTTSGTDKTWTWKTSDFSNPFPPGKYLRVTTDGGTLKQGSTVLKWDDHGYYEVSLDAGTLTLSAQ
jgi:hypothetical protein